MTFTLAIVGRPNVGKSTLFNRLARKKLAIVDDRPGVTRDWREAEGWLLDVPIRIIDTAGLENITDLATMEGRMRAQTESALSQANAVLFVVDGRQGLTPLDHHFAKWLRRMDKPVVLAVNKCESDAGAAAGLAEAWSLGLGDPVPMSAAHGHGFDDLYHALKPFLPEEIEDDDADGDGALSLGDQDLDAIEGQDDYDFVAAQGIVTLDDPAKPIKLAIVGRPNAGKSTLLNALIGEQRVMTGPEAGITRDAIAVHWEWKDRPIRLVDTAGLRRRARISDRLEKMAVEDTLRAIRLAQVVVLAIDGLQGADHQDLTIGRHVLDEGRALVIAVTKWDAVEDKPARLAMIKDQIEASLAQGKDAPLVTISALKGRGLDRLMDAALSVFDLWNGRVSTGRLNRWLSAMTQRHPPPLVQGRPNRIRYMTQVKARPPTFAIWVSKPDDLPETYERYIINGLKEDHGLAGTPIRILLRRSKNPFSD